MSSALPRPTVARAAGVALALVALTGCGAGFEAQTYQERSSADSTNVAVGAIAVRNVAVMPGDEGVLEAGDDAEVILTLVNVGGEDDRLVGAEAEGVDGVEITQDGDTVDAVDVPRLGTTGNTTGLVLRGLDEELYSGSVVPITLQLERAGEVVVEAPVMTTGEYDEEREKSDNFHPPGEEHSEEEGATGDTANEGEGGSEGGEGLSESGEQSTEEQSG